jgi:hypothetical protein
MFVGALAAAAIAVKGISFVIDKISDKIHAFENG